MRRFLVISFLFLSFCMKAQHKVEVGGNIGMTNFIGDVGGNTNYRDYNNNINSQARNIYFKYLKWTYPSITVSGFFKYKINKYILTCSQLSFVRLVASDNGNPNPYKVARNLSFSNNLIELTQTAEFNFLMRTKIKTNPTIRAGGQKRVDIRWYFFTGLGMFFSNPKAELDKIKYNLRPLKTEGVKYSPINWAIPFGVGVSYAFNKKLTLGLNYSFRFTGTDYLDDVSGFYKVGYKTSADPKNKLDYAMHLSNRTPEVQAYSGIDKNFNAELPAGVYYEKNSLRGNPSQKDGYFLANLSIGMIIKGRNTFYKTKSRALKVTRKKFEKKRVRAKF